MNIRRTNINDIDNNLLNIFIDGFEFHLNGRKDIFDNNKKNDDLKKDLIDLIENKNVLVAEKNNNILGFILVDDNKNNNYEISEIFVLNNYKRNKIGKESVTKVFNLHRGNWTIKAVPNSIIAESFWKNIVKEYTNNNYIEEYTGKYNRLEIYFSNGN